MTALEEARAGGGLGPQGVRLLYETVDAVRRFSGFPPPSGHVHWDESAVMAIAHDFVAAAGRVASLLLRATDEDSFERLLHTAVRNYLRSEYRKTASGRMMRSLRRAVEADQGLVTVAEGPAVGCWALGDHATRPPFAGRDTDLVDAAFAVEGVRLARWRVDARNRPPIAEADSLRRVVRAILEAAACPVRPGTVLRVVSERFPPVDSPPLVAITEVADQQAQASGGDPLAGVMAREVWDQLSVNERLVVGVLDEPVRAVADSAGLSRGTTHRAMLGAKQALAGYLADIDDPEALVAELRALSDLVREAGTRRTVLASDLDEEH